MMPTKINNTLVDCLKYTLTLRLEGTPPADVAKGMMAAWQATFDGLPWTWHEERDSQRLQQAFTVFWAHAEHFPTPRMIIDCLPPISNDTVPKLERKLTDAERAENRRQIQAILNNLTQRKTL